MLRWLVGIATLVAVILVVTKITEPRDFVRVVEHAEPWWLAIGFVLQASTYVAQGLIWPTVARYAGERLPLKSAVRIALAKLFLDQTLPSGGLSGGALLVGVLKRRGMREPVVRATLVVELASYYFAYAVGLTVAIVLGVIAGQMRAAVLIVAIAFVFVSVAISLGAIAIARMDELPKIRGIRRLAKWLTCSDRRLTADVGLLSKATGYQLAIIALDSVTLWTMLRAVGSHAPIVGVFAAFMIAALARTLAITPAGLGVFEGAGVLTLSKLGVPHAEALSATLLFRGLSYWLPLIPGFIASRGMR